MVTRAQRRRPGWAQLRLSCFSRVDKKRDKIERKILDSQERAFWDVHRPVVGEASVFIKISKTKADLELVHHAPAQVGLRCW